MTTPTTTDPWVVVVDHTVMDGQVVRWYRTEQQAANGREVMSASRNGVLVNGFMHEIPAALRGIADDLYRALAKGFDARHAATHERQLRGGTLRKIERTP